MVPQHSDRRNWQYGTFCFVRLRERERERERQLLPSGHSSFCVVEKLQVWKLVKQDMAFLLNVCSTYILGYITGCYDVGRI